MKEGPVDVRQARDGKMSQVTGTGIVCDLYFREKGRGKKKICHNLLSRKNERRNDMKGMGWRDRQKKKKEESRDRLERGGKTIPSRKRENLKNTGFLPGGEKRPGEKAIVLQKGGKGGHRYPF